MQNRSEQLCLRILEGARDRAQLKRGRGDRHYAVMVLRRSTFIKVLRYAPALISYELDLAASAPTWPAFVPKFETFVIELSEMPL